MRSKKQMIEDLLTLHAELEQLEKEKLVCLQMGEGFSLQKESRVHEECNKLIVAMNMISEAIRKIREGY